MLIVILVFNAQPNALIETGPAKNKKKIGRKTVGTIRDEAIRALIYLCGSDFFAADVVNFA